MSIILNWNDSLATIACAESLLAAALPKSVKKHQVIIVDNGSEAREVEALEDWLVSQPDESLYMIQNQQNLGFSGGMNQGIHRALAMEPTFIWLLNNDLQVSPESIQELVSFSDSRPGLMLAGSTMMDPEGDTVQTAGGYRYIKWLGWNQLLFKGTPLNQVTDLPEPKLDYVDGAAIWLRADFLRRAKGLSEDYFLYFEELALIQQLRPEESIGWCRGSLVFHRGSGSATTPEMQARVTYHAALSVMKYTGQYHPQCLPTVVLARIVGISLRALLRQQPGLIKAVFQAIVDFALGRSTKLT